MTMTHAVCHLCPNGCPVWADVREGKLVSAKRKPVPGVKKRRFCPKVHAAAEIVYSPERITTPMLRRNGRNSPWRPATWDEALTRVADGMLAIKADAGPQAVCWLKGTGIDWSPSWDVAIRLMHAFGSPNILGNGALCHATRDMANVYTYGAMTVPDYLNSNCILVWGANVKDSCPPDYDLLMSARKRGAKLIVVDPVRTDLAAAADIFLQVKPGGDGLLAMAMIQVLIAEGLYDRDFVDNWCTGFEALRQAGSDYTPERVAPAIWLDPESIRRAARLYAITRPACMADGNGVGDESQYLTKCPRHVYSAGPDRQPGSQRGGSVAPSGAFSRPASQRTPGSRDCARQLRISAFQPFRGGARGPSVHTAGRGRAG